MPLLILTPQPMPHFSLCTSPLHPPLFLTYFSLFLTPLGDMPCVSSTLQRKPKTRKILLKGVSRQPDINILLVCRAESQPLGICGYTPVCLCVCVRELLLCVAYLFTYHVSYLCHWVSLMFKVIQRKKEKKCVYSQIWVSTITQNSAFSSVKHIYFRYCTMAWCCVYHSKINNSPGVRWNSFCPRVPLDSAGWLYYACQSQWELDPIDWASA